MLGFSGDVGYHTWLMVCPWHLRKKRTEKSHRNVRCSFFVLFSLFSVDQGWYVASWVLLVYFMLSNRVNLNYTPGCNLTRTFPCEKRPPKIGLSLLFYHLTEARITSCSVYWSKHLIMAKKSKASTKPVGVSTFSQMHQPIKWIANILF